MSIAHARRGNPEVSYAAQVHECGPTNPSLVGVAGIFWAHIRGWIPPMPGVPGRRYRTGVANHIPLRVRLSPESHARAQQVADALGVSVTAYVDRLLAHDDLDAHSRPVWWGPAPRDQEELPLTAEEAPLKSA